MRVSRDFVGEKSRLAHRYTHVRSTAELALAHRFESVNRMETSPSKVTVSSFDG
jgi:hypothetical protein